MVQKALVDEISIARETLGDIDLVFDRGAMNLGCLLVRDKSNIAKLAGTSAKPRSWFPLKT